MTLSEILRIGDKVVFSVDPERRAWTTTYDAVPDGTEGVVCGFYDAVIYRARVPASGNEPGVYHQRGAVSVLLADGRIVPGDYSIDMIDKEEEKRRDAALRDSDGVLRQKQTRLGNLPSTKFWEQDKVRVRFPQDDVSHLMTIGSIEYSNMHKRRDNGSPWPFYSVKYTEGGFTNAEESWIELIERGNVWKYYNGQPLIFASLEEEAAFAHLIGQTEQMRNPESGLYTWTKEEVLDAIKDGTAHSLSVSNFLGSGPRVLAYRFKDEALGKRVAEKTLEGFEVPA